MAGKQPLQQPLGSPFRCTAARHFATSPAPPAAVQQSPVSLLATLTGELDKIAPRFELDPDKIQILQSPSEFYETLKAKISKAKRRIYLSTLYIGKTEHELISVLQDALRANPELRLSILTDALRGTREAPEPSCASLLAPLVAEFGSHRVEIRMFHTPNLTGWRKKYIPKRINEGWGLQHMKLYGVDDELIMSGANLSDDYFTNRQDRYHLFSSKQISDYFGRIHDSACSFSFSILPEGEKSFRMEWPTTNSAPSPLEDPAAFRTKAASVLLPLLQAPSTPAPPSDSSSTVVYPLLQFTPLLQPDKSTELPAIRAILTALATSPFSNSSWTFTAGYFNMTPEFRRLLLSTRPAKATVIAASPWANGFYGSKGVSGMLPAAYTYLSRRFLEAVSQEGLSQQITLKEWRRGTVNEPEGWTYHAKGLWVTLPGEEGPSVALVGSSNYTKRSYSLDLEANLLIVTRDEALKKRLRAEETWLQDYAKPVDRDEYTKTERMVGVHVRIAMWIVTILGGAL